MNGKFTSSFDIKSLQNSYLLINTSHQLLLIYYYYNCQHNLCNPYASQISTQITSILLIKTLLHSPCQLHMPCLLILGFAFSVTIDTTATYDSYTTVIYLCILFFKLNETYQNRKLTINKTFPTDRLILTVFTLHLLDGMDHSEVWLTFIGTMSQIGICSQKGQAAGHCWVLAEHEGQKTTDSSIDTA